MDERQRRSRDIQERIGRILYEDWDPLGLSGVAPRDEYDGYIGGDELTRPRDRTSPLFEAVKRKVLTALDRSLDRAKPDNAQPVEGAAMWW